MWTTVPARCCCTRSTASFNWTHRSSAPNTARQRWPWKVIAPTGLSSSASTANGGATAGGSKTSAAGSDPRAYTPTPLAQARASGQALQTGLREGPFHEERFSDEMEQAQAREDANPVTAGEARAVFTLNG